MPISTFEHLFVYALLISLTSDSFMTLSFYLYALKRWCLYKYLLLLSQHHATMSEGPSRTCNTTEDQEQKLAHILEEQLSFTYLVIKILPSIIKMRYSLG